MQVTGSSWPAGQVGKVTSIGADGRAYVRSVDWGMPLPVADLVPAQRPSHPPWCDGAGVTDVDGFLDAYRADPDVFWRVDSGHLQNVIDELIARLDTRED